MKKIKSLLTVFVFILLSGYVFSFHQPKAHAKELDDADTNVVDIRRGTQSISTRVLKETRDAFGNTTRPGSILIRFKPAASEFDEAKLHQSIRPARVERLFLERTRRIQVPEQLVPMVLALYNSNPAVEYAVPDRLMYAVGTPNDPRFAEQWGMTKINAPVAWDTSISSPSTRIAILDCGIYDNASTYISPDGQPGHPDVRSKVVARTNFTTAPNADDFCNHGTHVAGIAAATTNNAIGVAGTGYNASLVNVKVLGDNGSGSFSWIINGILWAAGCDTNPCGARRAEIINMSLGATASCDPLVQSAIDKAWNQGLVVVAAAGNSGASGAITPANCNNVVGVSASDQLDAKASFSNFGFGVDVAAPGVSILSTDYIGGYSFFNGTSMASPHVAGLAALLWNTVHNTGNAGVVNRVTQTANTDALAGSTYGRIDAAAAVGALSLTPTLTPTPTPLSTPSATPTSTLTPTPTPTPVPITCSAPIILSHTDSNVNRGGTISFSWATIPGATRYRVQRQNIGGSWSTRTTTAATNYTGSDSSTDPNWRVFVYAGSCSPIPGPATVFDP